MSRTSGAIRFGRSVRVAVLGAAVTLALAAAPRAQEPTEPPSGRRAASIEEFPWQVALVRPGVTPADGQFCGGSVIAPRWVLTAAHCFFREDGDRLTTRDVAVYLGSASLRGGGLVVEVQRIVLHPGHVPAVTTIDPDQARPRGPGLIIDRTDAGRPPRHDVALLQLATPVDVTPARLVSSTVLTAGTAATVTGWGLHPAATPAPGFFAATRRVLDGGLALERPTELSAVRLAIAADGPCSANGSQLDQEIVCTRLPDRGLSTCIGDSGGPLHRHTDSGAYVQIGVVSWGDRCERGDGLTVYANAGAYEGWTTQVMATPAPTHPESRATYGRLDLDAGPRYPVSVMLLAGGIVRADAFWKGCVGYVAAPPDLVVGYAGGQRPLYVSVSSERDTSLVVRSPDGRWHCANDTRDLDPALELADPVPGDYQMWVGSVAAGMTPLARLHVAEDAPRFEP